ncbi:MAG: multidrug efflux SMR transporter [Myxococcota bacterium]
MGHLYLAIAIAAEVTATACLKASEGFTKPLPSVVVVLGYGLAFYMLGLVLKTIPVGIAYAIWAGAGIVLTAAVGVVVFGQKLDAAAIAGMALIVAGVVVINAFSRSLAH